MSRLMIITQDEFLKMNTGAYLAVRFYNGVLVRTNYGGREVVARLNHHIKQKSQEN